MKTEDLHIQIDTCKWLDKKRKQLLGLWEGDRDRACFEVMDYFASASLIVYMYLSWSRSPCQVVKDCAEYSSIHSL